MRERSSLPSRPMSPLQPRPDLEVPAIVRKARRPRTPPLRRAVVARVLGLLAVGVSIGAATIHAIPDTVRGPLVSMSVAAPKPARALRISEASLPRSR
jgi:hypothetical protein